MAEANNSEFLLVEMLYWREKNFMKHVGLVSSDWLLGTDGGVDQSNATSFENGNLVFLKLPHSQGIEPIMSIEPWQVVPCVILAHNKDWRRLLPDFGQNLQPNKLSPSLNFNEVQNNSTASSREGNSANSTKEGRESTGASCSVPILDKDPPNICNLLLSVKELQRKVQTMRIGLIDIMQKLTILHCKFGSGVCCEQEEAEEQDTNNGRNEISLQSLEVPTLLEASTDSFCAAHPIDVEDCELKLERLPVFSSAQPTGVFTAVSSDGIWDKDNMSSTLTLISPAFKNRFFTKNVQEGPVSHPQMAITFGTRSLTATEVHRCNHSGKISTLAVELFCKLFSPEEMALSTLSGKAPNGHKHFIPKKKLDENVIHGIVDYICLHHQNTLVTKKVEFMVKRAIAMKLNNFSRTPEGKDIQCSYIKNLAEIVG